MTLYVSATPDVTERLPFPIGGIAVSAYPEDAGWDVTFGQLGFRLHASKDSPYRRETDQVQKQQFDTSDEAGEQSLSSWWLRSQSSWHMGAGIRWYEPGSEPDTKDRFADSCGVDVWTVGQLSLLRSCVKMGPFTGPNYMSTMRKAGVDGYLHTYNNNVGFRADGVLGPYAGTGGSGVTQPAISVGKAWLGFSGGVNRYDVETNTTTFPLTSTVACRAWWVKSRLIVAAGPALYEVSPTATGALQTVGTLLYTHQDAAWVWSDVDEAPGAVLAAGRGAAESAIFRFSVENDTTGQPKLTGASQVAKMPPGEQVHTMRTYLGAYIVLGTTSGLRVGAINAAGDVQYGPLTFTTPNPVVSLAFRDRFVYALASRCQPDGTTGCARVDLSAPVGSTGRYAWAWDATTGGTDDATSICLYGNQDRVVMSAGDYWYVQTTNVPVATGWVLGGNIRFRTAEMKAFRFARLNSEVNDGTVTLTAVAADGSEHRVYSYATQDATASDVGIQIPGRPTNQHLAFRIRLTAKLPVGQPSLSPHVTGFAVKAVPAATRMRLVQFPVSLFDFEVGRSGQRYGVEGGALARMLALEALEDSAIPVSVRHLASNDAFVGIIESTTFSSAAPPDRNQSGFGGVALVTVRKL